MRLIDYLIPEAIILDMKATTKDEAIRELIESLDAAGVFDAGNAARAMNSCRKREELGSTGTGRGTATPEMMAPNHYRMCFTVGLARQGIDFDSLDGAKVDLFMPMVYSLVPGSWICMAPLVGNVIRNDALLGRLRQARTREEVMAVIEADTTECTCEDQKGCRKSKGAAG
jgi:mannitol/fructose-specific phosphotransferase system IIA component (Ntr-type)